MSDETSSRLAPDELAFDYIKNSDFRVVWADGAVGAVTPAGLVHFALYAERNAIPQRQVYEVEKVGDSTFKLGEEILERRVARNSIVREMACDVLMSPDAAEGLAKWLLGQVAEIRARQEEK